MFSDVPGRGSRSDLATFSGLSTRRRIVGQIVNADRSNKGRVRELEIVVRHDPRAAIPMPSLGLNSFAANRSRSSGPRLFGTQRLLMSCRQR